MKPYAPRFLTQNLIEPVMSNFVVFFIFLTNSILKGMTR